MQHKSRIETNSFVNCRGKKVVYICKCIMYIIISEVNVYNYTMYMYMLF